MSQLWPPFRKSGRLRSLKSESALCAHLVLHISEHPHGFANTRSNMCTTMASEHEETYWILTNSSNTKGVPYEIRLLTKWTHILTKKWREMTKWTHILWILRNVQIFWHSRGLYLKYIPFGSNTKYTAIKQHIGLDQRRLQDDLCLGYTSRNHIPNVLYPHAPTFPSGTTSEHWNLH